MPTKKSSTEKVTPKEEAVTTTILPENGISSYFGEMVFGHFWISMDCVNKIKMLTNKYRK